MSSKKPGSLIILSGPSGAGKTTLRQRLQESLPDLCFSVSWTTRSPRAGEESGRDYRFVSQRQFEKEEAAGGFLEWARVHASCYGTPLRPIARWLKQGKDVLLDIDIQGARIVKKKIPQAVAVFILPPSASELRKRLQGRRTDSSAAIRLRLKNAEKELQAVKHFDYAVTNTDLDRAVEALSNIIRAARYRVT